MKDSFKTLLDLIGCGKPLGHGNYSQVFSTNRGTVVKLTVDDVYMTYVNKVSGINNKYLPKILNNFGIIGYVDSCGNENPVPVYAVEMPKYRKLKFDGDTSCLEESFNSLYKLCKYDIVRDNWSFEESMAELQNVLSSIVKMGYDVDDVFEAVNIIKNIEETQNCFYDMHWQNFMIDSEGNTVITDPIGGREHCQSLDTTRKVKESTALDYVDLEKIVQVSELISVGRPADIDALKFKKRFVMLGGVNENTKKITVVKSDNYLDVRREGINNLGGLFNDRGVDRSKLSRDFLGVFVSTKETLLAIKEVRGKMGLSLKAEDE